MMWTWDAPAGRTPSDTITYIHSFRPAFAQGAAEFDLSCRIFRVNDDNEPWTSELVSQYRLGDLWPYLAFLADHTAPVLIRTGNLQRFFEHHHYEQARNLANLVEVDATRGHIRVVHHAWAGPMEPRVVWAMDTGFLNDFLADPALSGLRLEDGVDLVGASGDRESGAWRLYPRQQDRYLVEYSDGSRVVATLGGLIYQLERNHQVVPEDLRAQPGLPPNRRI